MHIVSLLGLFLIKTQVKLFFFIKIYYVYFVRKYLVANCREALNTQLCYDALLVEKHCYGCRAKIVRMSCREADIIIIYTPARTIMYLFTPPVP